MPAVQETRARSLGQEDPLEKGMAIHSSILGESHRQRSLEDYNLWGRKELDMTDGLTLIYSAVLGLSCST